MMAFRRPADLQAVYDLEIDQECSLSPSEGETLKQAFDRLKLRTAKYAAKGRYYRQKIQDDKIVIQRVRKEFRGPLCDFLKMKPMTQILLKENPTDKDLKKAHNKTQKCSNNYEFNVRGRDGYYEAHKDRHGRLVIICVANALGEYREDISDDWWNWPLVHLWEGEWT